LIVRIDHDVPARVVQIGMTVVVIDPEDLAVTGGQLQGDDVVTVDLPGLAGGEDVALAVTGDGVGALVEAGVVSVMSGPE